MQKMKYFNHSIYFVVFFTTRCMSSVEVRSNTLPQICPVYKKGPNLNVPDLVGSWLTVYTQPKGIDCFKFSIRATTDLEREQYIVKYGNFSNRVQWDQCLLQVETSMGRHFLQGNGTDSGLMRNIVIFENRPGEYLLQNDTADQWMVFGRRGSEVLVIRDCYGETAAAFARAPYWPTVTELSGIFHRSGITAQTYGRSLCQPRDVPTKEYYVIGNISRNGN